MKLVRDRIPELAGAGQPAAFHQATEAEFARLLRDKLLEEAAEAATAAPDELLEQLGDVLQVLYALASQAGYSPAEIECARVRKARARGAFTRRVVWHDPLDREDPDDRALGVHRRPGGRLPGRRQEAPTATTPAPAVATTWRASGASSPPCCARPPPPASRMRRPPAGRRPRPCGPSTASSR